MPLVSVIVPNYNHAKYLPRRLDSILEQTFQDRELILLDDCSPDNSLEVLQAYAQKHSATLVRNEKNSGSTFKQWAKGLTVATGKYIWLAESDDYASPDLLKTLVAVMESRPEVGLAYCQSNRVDADGQPKGSCAEWTRKLHPTRWDTDFANSGRDEIAKYLVVQQTIPNASAVLTRADVLRRAVKGAGDWRLSGDWWTWARVLLESDVAFVASALNYFRCHERSVRDTVRPTLACEEGFRMRSYLCSQVQVPLAVRKRAFDQEFAIWRWCTRSAPTLNPKWLWKVHADARRLWPLASVRMPFAVAKNSVRRVLTGRFPVFSFSPSMA